MPSVNANDIQIAYHEVGQGDPLLLIMGLGAPGSVWEKHVAAYAKYFRCIVMDNRGAGDSDKPEGPYSTATMADDAAGLLDALQISNARVAGISMGSGIAQELALRHPAKVQSMVLISSWARCDTYMREIFLHFTVARPRLARGDFMRLLQLWIFALEYFNSSFADLEEGKATADQGFWMPDHAFVAQCQACIQHNALARLGAVKQPCLLTVGNQDIFTPAHFSEEMVSALPSAELKIFKNTGHCHHWENLSEFNDMTVKFLLEH